RQCGPDRTRPQSRLVPVGGPFRVVVAPVSAYADLGGQALDEETQRSGGQSHLGCPANGGFIARTFQDGPRRLLPPSRPPQGGRGSGLRYRAATRTAHLPDAPLRT